jgi:hypothetical protein
MSIIPAIQEAEAEALAVLDQMDLTDMYRTFHPTGLKCILSKSSTHEIFFGIDHS